MLLIIVLFTGCVNGSADSSIEDSTYCRIPHEEQYLNDESKNETEDEPQELPVAVTLRPRADWHEQFAIMHSLELSDAAVFYDTEYVLLVARCAGRFGDGLGWSEFSVMGGTYTDFESGRDLYERINALYTMRRAPVGRYADTRIPGLYRHLFERHVIRLSSDGTRVLTATSVCRYSALIPFLYEAFEGENQLWSFRHEHHYLGFLLYTPTPNMRFASDLNETVFHCMHTGDEVVFPWSSSPVPNFYETRFAYIVQKEGGAVIKIRDVQLDKTVFASNLLVGDLPSIRFQYVGEKYIILNDRLNYYRLDINTGDLYFLFSKPVGTVSPDGRFLAFTSVQPWIARDSSPEHTEHMAGLDTGIFIHELATGKTVFYPVSLAVPEYFGYGIVSWANISGLYALSEG